MPPFFALSENNIALDILKRVFDYIPVMFEALKDLVGFLIGLSFPLSLFFFIGIIYVVERLKRLRKKEEQMFDTKVEPAFEDVPPADMAITRRWHDAQAHISSSNPNDWKQAIIDCDIILDDLLNKLGYRGESIGEKLKRVNTGEMKALDDAWEAHKVRNRIAHEPGFSLDHHEAKKVFHHYRKVFEEFYYI